MDEKLKAVELVKKFCDLDDSDDKHRFGILEIHIKSALICVDEIIENNYKLIGGSQYHEELNYWQEVKNEIAKLDQ